MQNIKSVSKWGVVSALAVLCSAVLEAQFDFNPLESLKMSCLYSRHTEKATALQGRLSFCLRSIPLDADIC